MFVCVREREREKVCARERECVCARESVCVCVRARVCVSTFKTKSHAKL